MTPCKLAYRHHPRFYSMSVEPGVNGRSSPPKRRVHPNLRLEPSSTPGPVKRWTGSVLSAGGGRRAGVVDGQAGLLVVDADAAGRVGGRGDAGEVPADVQVLSSEVGELGALRGVGLGGERPEELAV